MIGEREIERARDSGWWDTKVGGAGHRESVGRRIETVCGRTDHRCRKKRRGGGWK